jgi:hypothetical protein
MGVRGMSGAVDDPPGGYERGEWCDGGSEEVSVLAETESAEWLLSHSNQFPRETTPTECAHRNPD